MVGAKKKKKGGCQHTTAPIVGGDVWWVNDLSFSGNPGSKSRPVLIISTCGEGMVNCMEITSQTSSSCAVYELLDYISAGLDHESYVKLQNRQISKNKLTKRIGRLCDEDIDAIPVKL